MTVAYDAFLSFAPADAAWVEHWLLPRLQRAGLTIATDFDFALGRPLLINIEQMVDASRHTLLVLSPAWLRNAWSTFEGLLVQTSDPTGLQQRLIPVLRQPCELPGRIAMLDAADLTGAEHQSERQFERLLRALAPTDRPAASIPLDTVPAVAPLPPISRMPLAPNPLFVGRDEELRTLAHTLTVGATTAIAAATGLGGIGKTQLASEFVHRYGQFFPGGVFWLSFADAAAVPGEVAACGGIGAMDLPNFAALSTADQVARVRQEWQHSVPRLLVFDNCEDEELLTDWRPTSGGCQVLLTACRGAWDASLGVRTLPLEVLPRARSVELLRQFRPELREDNPDLAAIAEELGDLPLALHVAGSYLKQYRADVRPADYLDELHAAPLAHESLTGDEPGLSPTRHDLSIHRSIKLSYDKLDAAKVTDALALDLLARAASFASGEPIPRDLLLKTLELPDASAQRRASRAITRLVNLGLLEIAEDDAPRLHRLIAAFVRAEQRDTRAQRAVEQLLKDTSRALLNKGIPAPLSAIQVHLRHVTDMAQARDDTYTSDLCAIMGRYLQLIGSYTAARSYLEHALEIEEGRDDQDVGRLSLRLDSLATVLQDLGDYTAARPLFESALAIAEQLYGPEHPTTGTRLNNLALLLKTQGDYTTARPLFERALALAEASLGPEHPTTGTRLNNLAGLLRAQGDDTTARPLFERALAIAEASLGPEHPTIGIRLNNLALLFKTQGDYTTARPLYERALAIAEASLGSGHPDTGTRLNNLAGLLQAQGDYTTARPLFERALAIREQTLGPSHPDTAQSLWWIATLLKQSGDLDGARERLVRAVAIYRRTLGVDHSDTQGCQRWLDSLDPPASASGES